MAAIPIRNFVTLVENFAAGVQGRATALVDFSVGAVLRAVAEATADLTLWLESLIVYVLTLTRAATSSGADLDSWVNDFGLTRLGAAPSSGSVVFSRFTATVEALIPVGATVQTEDGSQTFTVVADSTVPSFSLARNGYVVPIGVAQAAVPVKADIPSAASNVLKNTITVITSATPGIDTVINLVAFANGSDAETDEALRVRKTLFFASLAKATNPAIAFAVSSLELGIQYQIVENESRDGSPNPGFIYVVVDDGTGAPGDDLLADVTTAIYAVRASGIIYAVFPPTVRNVRIEMHVEAAFGYLLADVEAAVSKAISTFVNGLGLGAGLTYTRLVQVAYDASPGVKNVTGLTVNGAKEDIAPSPQVTIKAPTIVIG
ncbi:baseplate J/gp47 family protein [Methylobacterium haplocladii]|uniref:Baseplate protein J-like barrel domain-containing protein n=1 Tax=Methylobacterium haplocladii TaxID=1176176 RepID=A0A512ISD7_9HYPH|nr:baseplate J/gp47 family protein [Methylobacterium haplocladii]GEP00625.1 hypothetical protein MHA02_30120 [Methylobacterium haplocladii]GJD85540.1 hypothetical protein HPGCJGGD_3429 [Methylobacterium haplocladii]GLS57773.1 hypothetical protein GCM10007887_04290 [Methylobacterium haplocladii]